MTMQLTCGMDALCAGKKRTFGGTNVTIFSHMTRDVYLFLSNVTQFLDCFFWKLPYFHTSNFRNVVRQYTEGMVGSITCVLLEIYLAFQQ